nr:hypothetical protein TorRG33x02_170390 [Ipomoea batatas]
MFISAPKANKVTRQEEQESQEQTTIDKDSLLARGESITTQSKLLILGETRNLHALALEETLGRPTTQQISPPISSYPNSQPLWVNLEGFLEKSLVLEQPVLKLAAGKWACLLGRHLGILEALGVLKWRKGRGVLGGEENRGRRGGVWVLEEWGVGSGRALLRRQCWVLRTCGYGVE